MGVFESDAEFAPLSDDDYDECVAQIPNAVGAIAEYWRENPPTSEEQARHASTEPQRRPRRRGGRWGPLIERRTAVFTPSFPYVVIPAKAGIQVAFAHVRKWIPAFAGMTAYGEWQRTGRVFTHALSPFAFRALHAAARTPILR